MANKSTCTVKGVINGVNLLESDNISRTSLISIYFSLRVAMAVTTKRITEVIKILEEKGIMNENDKHYAYL